MTFKNYALIFILSALKLTASQFCNENEIFSPVINPCNSCAIKGWCPQEVGFGCDCFPGYLRNSYGLCVPPEECDVITIPPEELCGPNEVYTDCENPCNTCQNRNVTCNFLVCNRGCNCRPGYTRNDQRICIPEQLCPSGPQCGIPKCLPGCRLDYNSKPCPSCRCEIPTGPQCSIPKCESGCRIDYTSKPCPSCKCGIPTGPQCSWPKCGPGCEINLNSKPCPSCKCETDGNGPTTRCGRNEVFKNCGSACPATCENPRPGPCTLQCVPGCFCINGYIRRGKRCVPPSECRGKPPGPYGGIRPRSYGYGPAYPPALPPAFPPPPPPPPLFPPPPPPPPLFPPPPPPPPLFPPPPPPPLFPPPPPPPLFPPPPAFPPPLPPARPPAFPPLPPAYPPLPPPPPPAFPPPLPPKFPPPLPPKIPPPLPPKFPPPPPPPPLPPPLPPKFPPPPPPPPGTNGCPDRNRCNKYCRSIGQTIGFCVGDKFLTCNCLK